MYEKIKIKLNTPKVPVSLHVNILNLRFSSVPYNLYGTDESLRLKVFGESDTCIENGTIRNERQCSSQALYGYEN